MTCEGLSDVGREAERYWEALIKAGLMCMDITDKGMYRKYLEAIIPLYGKRKARRFARQSYYDTLQCKSEAGNI